MSSHSPQRSRKPQAHQSQGSVHNSVPPRDMSPSPTTQRPRTSKANSMPVVMQLFNANQQASQGQSSPTTGNRRSPPLAAGQIHRGLPTPPHPPVPIPEQNQERRINSPSPQAVNPHYPRPVRQLSSHLLASFQGVDDNLHMTDELLADIERADQQRNQGFAYTASSYPVGYPSPSKEDASSPKDPVVERVRNTGKSSPKDLDGRRQQHRPQSRDKQAGSPMNQPQNPSQSPERRSPSYHTPLGSPGESTNSYVAINQKGPISLSLPPHTPPALAAVRTPDKSLPVQEEPEDEHPQMRARKGTHDWMANDNDGIHHRASPAPSSDLHPEGNNQRSHRDDAIRGLPSGRSSRAGHRDEDDDETLIEQSSRSMLGSSSSNDEEGHTPRSPASVLPDIPPDNRDRYQQYRGAAPISAPRPRGRTAVADQLDMRSLHPDILEQNGAPDRRDEPPQYVESRSNNNNKPGTQPQPRSQQGQRDHHDASNHGRYFTSQMFTDEFMRDPTSAYLQALLGPSPRPDAPIPPTPHSQTSPPSPSQASFDPRHELPPFSPVAPVGSPYPYPFTHVRRNYPSSYSGNRPESYENVDLNHPSVISEQIKRQYQIYAQNNLGGHISDSTFSPASTPFPPHANYFNQWANWHTHKILGNPLGNVVRDPMSITSSPSHEPISLPVPPTVGYRKKEKDPKANLKRTNSMVTRKPPPRVESTQPRETSPEPSSSGESTAGEDTMHQQFALPEEGNWVNGNLPVRLVQEDELGDWIDEDEYEDEDDLLELEFHPNYVNNVEKRRRRWETKWDALLQAFQALDRQTDATLLLLASPSHSTKLHLVCSRSLRRTGLSRSPALNSMRSSFRTIATQRRSIRSIKSSLAHRLLTSQSSSPSSPGGVSREEDLQRALNTALGSLGALGRIYDEREARWKEEMSRISDDRERIEMLLKQALGDNAATNNADSAGQIH